VRAYGRQQKNYLFVSLAPHPSPLPKGEGVKLRYLSTVERRDREGGAKPPLPAQL
jgi:hypothetical protein